MKCLISSFIFIVIQTLIGSPHAMQIDTHCSPSSCGSIRNISYPFRLKDDPSNCGIHDYELVCENNNTTILTIFSHKYIVQSINYSNYTIRLMDSSINSHDNCSFPNHSLSRADFQDQYRYTTQLYTRKRYFMSGPRTDITTTITVMSCSSPANNPLLLDISPTCVGRRRHTYVKLGILNASYVMEMCTIETMTMTSSSSSSSSSLLNDEKSVSLSEIHSSLVYGFELSWFNALCGGKCTSCWLNGTRAMCDGYVPCSITTYWSFHCGKTELIGSFFFLLIASLIAHFIQGKYFCATVAWPLTYVQLGPKTRPNRFSTL